jgi:hypothetical protein
MSVQASTTSIPTPCPLRTRRAPPHALLLAVPQRPSRTRRIPIPCCFPFRAFSSLARLSPTHHLSLSLPITSHPPPRGCTRLAAPTSGHQSCLTPTPDLFARVSCAVFGPRFSRHPAHPAPPSSRMFLPSLLFGSTVCMLPFPRPSLRTRAHTTRTRHSRAPHAPHRLFIVVHFLPLYFLSSPHPLPYTLSSTPHPMQRGVASVPPPHDPNVAPDVVLSPVFLLTTTTNTPIVIIPPPPPPAPLRP